VLDVLLKVSVFEFPEAGSPNSQEYFNPVVVVFAVKVTVDPVQAVSITENEAEHCAARFVEKKLVKKIRNILTIFISNKFNIAQHNYITKFPTVFNSNNLFNSI